MQVIQCEFVQKPTLVCLLVGSEAKNPLPISKYKDMSDILCCTDISLNTSSSLIKTIRKYQKIPYNLYAIHQLKIKLKF